MAAFGFRGGYEAAGVAGAAAVVRAVVAAAAHVGRSSDRDSDIRLSCGCGIGIRSVGF